ANGENGLWIANGAHVSLTGTQILQNTNSGLLADKSTVSVSGGSVTGNAEDGVRFTDGSTGKLNGVTITGNGQGGVPSVSSSVDMSTGAVSGNMQVGIDCLIDSVRGGTGELAVDGTQVCGNQGPGIRAADTVVTLTDVTLCANTAEGLRQTDGTAQLVRAR